MVLSSLEQSWPTGASLYTSAVVAIEIHRLRRLVDEAAELQSDDRLDQLELVHIAGIPSTIASRLPAAQVRYGKTECNHRRSPMRDDVETGALLEDEQATAASASTTTAAAEPAPKPAEGTTGPSD